MRGVPLSTVSLAIDARDAKNMLLGVKYIRYDRETIRTACDYAFSRGTLKEIRDLLHDY
jgi:hypothetical protein